MALFVFGAGATRGCSFVEPTKFPCLPPLDKDFFTQLQRVANPKHRDLVEEVMSDVVEIFGPNFDVTMETVFTTLEHSIRMLRTTGTHWAFSPENLKGKKDRLEQAIAAVLEESLTENSEGASSLIPRACTHHETFVRDILRPRDSIITFNYDCVLDFSLQSMGTRKWNARYGYGFNLGQRGRRLDGHAFWQPRTPASQDATVKFFKLHGSLHFDITGPEETSHVHLKQRPYTKQFGTRLHFSIIPPEWMKQFDRGAFGTLWAKAAKAIHGAKDIIFVGYSLPATDLHSTALFRTSVRSDYLRSLIVVNPDPETRKRTRNVMQRGLTVETRVLSFNSLPEFLAIDRDIWGG